MTRTQQLIKALRATGLKQADISRRSGVPQHSLSRWEAGRPPDAAEHALSLSELLQSVTVPAGEPPRQVATDQPSAS